MAHALLLVLAILCCAGAVVLLFVPRLVGLGPSATRPEKGPPVTQDGGTAPPGAQQPPPKSRRKTLRILLAGSLFGMSALFLLLLWRENETAKRAAAAAKHEPPKITITTATAKKGDIGVYLDAIGTVTPEFTASMAAQVTGQVAAVHYKEGQLVSKGDPLVDIDSRLYRATLLQAQGLLQRDEQILAQSKMDLVRYQQAWARNAIQKQTLDDQEKLVEQNKGTVKNDEGTVQYDQLQVDYCHITAPFAGRVGLRLVDPGNLIQATGTVTLAVVTQLQPITVIFTIPEDSLGPVQSRLRENAKLRVDAYDRSGQHKLASGELLALDNQIDTTTGTVKARAVFDNSNDELFPNQFVNSRLLVKTLEGVTLLPSSALQRNGQAAFVYVVQDNIAHIRTVKPGVTDGNSTQVDGLDAGEVVADSSFDKLQDKSAVVVANPAAAPSVSASNAP